MKLVHSSTLRGFLTKGVQEEEEWKNWKERIKKWNGKRAKKKSWERGKDIIFVSLYVCVGGMCLSQQMCGGDRTTWRSQCSPSTMWTLELELRSSGYKLQEPSPLISLVSPGKDLSFKNPTGRKLSKPIIDSNSICPRTSIAVSKAFTLTNLTLLWTWYPILLICNWWYQSHLALAIFHSNLAI